MNNFVEALAIIMDDCQTIDYETYRAIMDELLSPIDGESLELDTLKRLYESKLVYLDSLRTKCFLDMNNNRSGFFQMEDYELILKSISNTKSHIRKLVISAVSSGLASRKVS